MVDPKAVAAVVAGALLAIGGGLGALVVAVGTLADVLNWNFVAWGLLLAFAVGAGLLTYGAVGLAGGLGDAVADGDLGAVTDEFDVGSIRRFID